MKRVLLIATLTLAAAAPTAFALTPRVEWTDIGTTGEVELSFPNVPKGSPFAAILRVENAWSDNKEPVTGTKASPKFVHKITRTHRFSFEPYVGFSNPQYKGVVSNGLSFDPKPTLDVRLQNPFRGTGKDSTRIGTLKIAVLYGGKQVAAQDYIYTISQATGHMAKQGSDDYFNYCVKQHPETVFQSGGVLMCHVPGGTVLLVRKLRR